MLCVGFNCSSGCGSSKTVIRNLFQGVFSCLFRPFPSFPLPLPSFHFPLYFSASSVPSNSAKGFGECCQHPQQGRTTFAATIHVPWAIGVARGCIGCTCTPHGGERNFQACRGYEIIHPYPYPYPQIFRGYPWIYPYPQMPIIYRLTSLTYRPMHLMSPCKVQTVSTIRY